MNYTNIIFVFGHKLKVKQKNRCLMVTIQSAIVNQKQFLDIKFEGYWDVVMISYKDIFEVAVVNLEKLKALGIEFDLVYSSTPTYLVGSIPFLKRLYCLSNRLFNPNTIPPLIIREILVANIAIKIIGGSFTSCAYSSTCLQNEADPRNIIETEMRKTNEVMKTIWIYNPPFE